MLNLELYKVFYHAAKSGSVSKAAKELFISQPAVSQSIRQLEEQLGGQVFFRTHRGITLTREGEVLYRYIEQAYNFISLAERKFAEVKDLMAGEIFIGASDMSCKYYLLPYLEEFRRLYPKVEIRVTNAPTPSTLKNLKKGVVDFGVISLPVEEDEQIVIHEGMEIQDCFVAGERYAALASREIKLQELASYPVLLLEPNSTTRRYIDAVAASHGVTLRPEIELATSDLLVQFACRGLGIACVVRNFAEEELKDGKLFEVRIQEPIPPRKLGVAMLRQVPPAPAARRFLELMGM